MRVLFFIAILFLTSCKVQQNSNSTHKPLKENQLRATVLHLPLRSKEGLDNSKNEFYLKIDNKNYFVKLSECFVSEATLLKYVNKEIVIRGQIKSGAWEHEKASSFGQTTEPEKPRSGPYVVIEKVYKNK